MQLDSFAVVHPELRAVLILVHREPGRRHDGSLCPPFPVPSNKKNERHDFGERIDKLTRTFALFYGEVNLQCGWRATTTRACVELALVRRRPSLQFNRLQHNGTVQHILTSNFRTERHFTVRVRFCYGCCEYV